MNARDALHLLGPLQAMLVQARASFGSLSGVLSSSSSELSTDRCSGNLTAYRCFIAAA